MAEQQLSDDTKCVCLASPSSLSEQKNVQISSVLDRKKGEKYHCGVVPVQVPVGTSLPSVSQSYR